jgi:hypothetical protein
VEAYSVMHLDSQLVVITFIFRSVSKIAKSTISFVMSSVRPHGTTQLPLKEFS